MSLLRKRSWWQRLFHSRLMLAFLVVLAGAVSLAVYDRYVVEREVASRRQEKEAELSALLERRAVLEERVNYLKEEQGIESEIRRHFDVAREGERVIVLTGEMRPASNTAPPAPPAEPSGFWRRIWPW